MTVIKKAIVKSYDAAAHKATVQIAGSLGVWLDAVRVATDIPAADVIAGRECTVLFQDPSNQDDAVVITIQGALPSGGGGGVTDHGALTGLGDDDHTQYGALAQAETWAALQTFNAGLKLAASQQIRDSNGTGRFLLATSNPHVTLGGNGGVRVNNYLGIQTDPATIPGNGLLRIAPSVADASVVGAFIAPEVTGSEGSNVNATGLFGTATSKHTGGTTGATGLAFTAQLWTAGASAKCAGLAVKHSYILQTNSVLSGHGLRVDTPASAGNSHTMADTYGIEIKDQKVTGATQTRIFGLLINDMTNGVANYLLWAGAGSTGTPRLRLDAGVPDANQTMLYLAEGATPTVRRVQWKDGASIGAGDKTLVLV